MIPGDFDNKIYRVSYKQNECFKKQLLHEQTIDPIIKSAFMDIQNDRKIVRRLKRVRNQLRIENGILTKSGRPIVPPPPPPLLYENILLIEFTKLLTLEAVKRMDY